MKVMVTGSNGMLGRDLCVVLQRQGHEVVAADRQQMDITWEESVRDYVGMHKPDAVIHCAAYTNVDKAEHVDYDLCEEINYTGTQHIAEICSELDIKLIYISTDYVFDGTKDSRYKPYDRVCPINHYGFTKLHGEQTVLRHCKKYFIARTSWLYGIYGDNFVETILHISGQKQIKVISDQVGCPTWTVDLAYALERLLRTDNYGIYHLCGAGETSWYGLTNEIFRLEDVKDVEVVPVLSEDLVRPAKRPLHSVLDNLGQLRPWQEALADYLKVRKELRRS